MSRRRARCRGQAMVELGLIAPVLLVLLVGAAQVGALLYAQIQVDTAAREGALAASLQPNGSAAFSGGNPVPAPGYTCGGSGDMTSACVAVRNSSGLLDATKFQTVVLADCTTFGTCSAGAGDASCATTWVADGAVSTTVSYQVPIFIPLLNHLLADPGKSYRTVSAGVTDRVTPCTMNQGH